MDKKEVIIRLQIPTKIRRRWLIGLVLVVLAVAVTAAAADFTSFSSGESLSSSKLNSNFGALQDRIAALEAAGTTPSGTIVAYGGVTAPAGWTFCDGHELSRATYAPLFAAIGVSFGGGDGNTTFNVPDLRGRFLRGVDGTAGRDPDKASRGVMATGGSSGNSVGSVQGDVFASHDHGGGSHSHSFATSPCTHSDYAYTHLALNGNGTYGGNCGDDNSNTRASGTIISAQGGNETRPTNAYVNFIIKL